MIFMLPFQAHPLKHDTFQVVYTEILYRQGELLLSSLQISYKTKWLVMEP
jgi:hypothetical protein